MTRASSYPPAYVDKALAETVRRISTTPGNQGRRNQTIFSETRSVARLIGHGGLTEQKVREETLRAAATCGYISTDGERAALSTINSAIAAGRKNPRTAPLNKYEVKRITHLGSQPNGNGHLETHATRSIILGPKEAVVSPSEWPQWTSPGPDGKPFFYPGDEPKRTDAETRRHLYRRGGVAVRCKVKYADGGWVDFYRVQNDRGVAGWQARKPEGFSAIPYTGCSNPFGKDNAGEEIFWPEGEKDCDTLTEKLGLLGVTFGGVTTGLPDGVEEYFRGRAVVILPDNDPQGLKHAERKASAIVGAAKTVKVLSLPGLNPKEDISDWHATGHKADDLLRLVDETSQWSSSETAASEPQKAVQWEPGLDVIRLADVKTKPIEWLWNKRIALGKVTVLAGEGGLGKSTILFDLAARVTTGEVWPDGEANGVTGNVIVLAAEDALDDTIKPRVIAARGDPSRIFCIQATKEQEEGYRRAFNFQADIQRMEEWINKIGNVRLIIIDPVSSYLGKLDSHKNDQVRAVLDPLGQLAMRAKAAFICNNHFSKGGGNANSRIIGSVAFVNQARAAFIVSPDPDDESRRLFMPSKMNIAALGDGLGYRIGGLEITADGISAMTSQVCWDSSPVTMSADTVLAKLSEGDDGRSAIDEAQEFLRNILAGGPLPANEVKSQASSAGIAWATVRRAKDGLVETRAEGGPGKDRWKWHLQAKVLNEGKDAHDIGLSPLGAIEHLSGHG